MEGEEELFEVEYFLNTRVKDGRRYYKVRWKGFSPEEDTWEPEENVLECEEVLTSFWEKKRRSANRKQKKRRYRLMSEEEDHETAKSAGSLSADIEPLGLTRQASKELAMCLNKSRIAPRHSDSSYHTGSDVTQVENFESSQTSTKSSFLSSQTGSDITSSDDVLSQISDMKSSHSGSDVLNRSTESPVKDSSSNTGVIDVSSQEFVIQSDIDSSPQDSLSKNKTSGKIETSRIEIISLLSDSEDTEGEASETRSPRVLKSPRDVVLRDSSPVTPPSLSHSKENSYLEKSTDCTPKSSKEQSPTKEHLEVMDLFTSPGRRKNRFELSLKKNRKRSLNESSGSESSNTKESQNVEDSKTKDTGTSCEVLVKETRKTRLQQLKENMSVLENTTTENSDFINPEVDIQPDTESEKITSEIVEMKWNESSLSSGDVCPTLTELKGIMHKIANKKYEHKDLELDEDMVDLKTRDSSDIFPLSPQFPPSRIVENISVVFDGGSEGEQLHGPIEVREQQRKEELSNSVEIVCELVGSTCLDSSGSARDGFSDLNELVSLLDGNEKNTRASLMETEPKDETEIIKDSEQLQKETADIEVLNDLEKSACLKTDDYNCGELQENVTNELIFEKDCNKEEEKHQSLADVSNSSNKVLALTSETTTRVLKNFRSLAAKSRKGVETMEKKILPEGYNSNVVMEGDLGVESNVEDRNSKCLLEEELLQNEGKLHGIGNKNETKITGTIHEEKANENEEIFGNQNNYSSELELLVSKTKTSHDQSLSADNMNESMDDNNDNTLKKTNNIAAKNETGQPAGIESGENGNFQPVIQETTELMNSPCTSKSVASSNIPSKDSIPVCEDKTSDNNTSINCETAKNTSNSKKLISRSTEVPFDSQSRLDGDASGSRGYQDEQLSDKTLKKGDFQKHCEEESCSMEDENGKKSGKSKKDLKSIHEKTAPEKSFKRKKNVHSDTDNQNSENSNLNQGAHRGNITSAKLKNPKALKHNKINKQVKSSKKENNTSTGERGSSVSRATSREINPPLESTKDGMAKKGLIVNANYSSSLSSGDLIGLIIDEGNRENTLKESEKSKSVDENKSANDLQSVTGEQDMVIDDDEDNFDFELEEFPLEKLLQEEDEISLRNIPSPPVQPLDIPFASVKTAIRDGDEMTVRAALAGGLELDTLDGASGMTLLMIAAASGQDGVVELLLRRKAEVNACQKNGMTALMHSCEQGYPETAHILLLCGADINKQQIAGETALMKACKKGHTDVVEVLLLNGADIKLEAKSGHTAQQFSIRGYPELSSLIEEHEKRLGRVVEEAILKCLGDTVCLCKPAILSYRCVVPREGQQMTFPFQFSPQNYSKDVDVVLFCIKAVFDDVMTFLFGEENGIRGVLLNNKPQIPLLHGIRSIFSIDPKPRHNTITLQTHKCNSPASKIIVCIYAVQSRG